MERNAISRLAAAAFIAAFLPASQARAGDSGRITIAASLFPIASIAREVGGDLVEVNVILKPGSNPHTYEPTPGDAKAIARAGVVLLAGFGLDAWLEKLVASAGKKGAAVIRLSDAIAPIEEEHDHDDGHGHGGVNPHYWLDPVRMAGAVNVIRGALIRLDPARAKTFNANADDVIARLKALDAEISAMLAGAKGGYVAFHAAWDYFAARYGLVEVGVIEESPGREPSARKMAALAAAIKQTGARAVIVEPQFPQSLGAALAREVGVAMELADPQGGVPGRMNYFELMRFNAAAFARALK